MLNCLNHDISIGQQKAKCLKKGFRSGKITALLSVRIFIQRKNMGIHRHLLSDARDTCWGKAVKGRGLFLGTDGGGGSRGGLQWCYLQIARRSINQISVGPYTLRTRTCRTIRDVCGDLLDWRDLIDWLVLADRRSSSESSDLDLRELRDLRGLWLAAD